MGASGQVVLDAGSWLNGTRGTTITREQIVPRSSNMYAYLGLPNAGEVRARADLVARIAGLLKDEGLTQTAAENRPGLFQPTDVFRFATLSISRSFREPIDETSRDLGKTWKS